MTAYDRPSVMINISGRFERRFRVQHNQQRSQPSGKGEDKGQNEGHHSVLHQSSTLDKRHSGCCISMRAFFALISRRSCCRHTKSDEMALMRRQCLLLWFVVKCCLVCAAHKASDMKCRRLTAVMSYNRFHQTGISVLLRIHICLTLHLLYHIFLRRNPEGNRSPWAHTCTCADGGMCRERAHTPGGGGGCLAAEQNLHCNKCMRQSRNWVKGCLGQLPIGSNG